jgi:di/tricarboxylate transporter
MLRVIICFGTQFTSSGAFQKAVQAFIFRFDEDRDLFWELVILHCNPYVYYEVVNNLAIFKFVVDCREQATSRHLEDMRNGIEFNFV